MAEHDILAELREVKRRLADLERATRLEQFSGGEDIGDGGYGGAIVLNNLENEINPATREDVALLIAQHGFELPSQPLYWRGMTESETITSGTFVVAWQAQAHQATSDGLEILIPWVTDPGTTGEIRITNVVVGGTTTDTVTLGAGTSGFASFAWLHSQPIGTGPFRPGVQARRTGGAGNVYVFGPEMGHQVGGRWIDAVVDGIP